MEGKKIVRKAVAIGACAAMLAGTTASPAFAYQNQAFKGPTSETPVINADGTRNIKSIGMHGSAVLGEYVGMDQTVNEMYATPGNGVTVKNYMYNPYMGVFGTSVNENPDVYTANLFYNWYAEATNAALTEGATALKKSNNAMINYLPTTAGKGSSFVADASEMNGTCIALAARPDVLTLHTTGMENFDSYIKAINEASPSSEYYQAASSTYVGDAKYNPERVTYDESNAGTQIGNMWRTAEAAAKVEAESAAAGIKAVTRYGDSMETAYNYELYTRGSVLYTMSKIADGTVKKKTVAFVKGIDGDGKDATVTLYTEPDPSLSREMMHHIECTVATTNNLAHVLNPTLERGAGKDGNSASVTCSVADLAKADVIILADPDNMAYNFGTKTVDKGNLPKPSWTKYPKKDAETGAAEGTGSAANNWGQDGATSYRTDGDGHYKNEFYGPQSATNTMVSTLKEALYDLNTKAGDALAKKNILSCVQEGTSSSDGGSIEAMSQYGIINAFIYPEIASGVNQYAWWLNNIAHVKTEKVANVVRILCQDMSLANGASLSDVSDYDSKAITNTYVAGLRYYVANKSVIDSKYPWLTPTENLTLPTVAKQTISVKPTAKTFSYKKVKKAAQSATFTVSGAKTKVTATGDSKAKKAKISIKVSGSKITVKVPKKTKKGTYKITVKCGAKAGYYTASNAKTITLKVK